MQYKNYKKKNPIQGEREREKENNTRCIMKFDSSCCLGIFSIKVLKTECQNGFLHLGHIFSFKRKRVFIIFFYYFVVFYVHVSMRAFVVFYLKS